MIRLNPCTASIPKPVTLLRSCLIPTERSFPRAIFAACERNVRDLEFKLRWPIYSRLDNVYWQVLGCILCGTVFLIGCSAIQLPQYKVEAIDKYGHSGAKEGVAIAIQPLTNSQEVEKYFGTDLLAEGVLPVLVFAENRSADSSYVLSKATISLSSGSVRSDRSAVRETLQVDSAAHAVHIAGTLIAAAPFAFPAGIALWAASEKMAADSTEIKYNLTIRELQTRTISPRKTAWGFVYFKLPEKEIVADQWVVHLEILNLQSKNWLSFDIPLK